MIQRISALIPSSTLHFAAICGGPREDLSGGEGVANGYILPGHQVVLADNRHELTDCGQISRWSMIFRCTASIDGAGYPLELQVFRQLQARLFRLSSSARFIVRDEQCESPLVTFNVSLPFCRRDHIGIFVPNLEGLTGLGYREPGRPRVTYLNREFSVPPSVGDQISFENDLENRAIPLVSIEGILHAV